MSDPTPRVPSVGADPRERPDDVEDAPGKIWFRDLDEAVIEPDRCIQCGTCVAACPSDSIGIDEEEGRPTLVRMCTGCSSCWDYCPRSGLRYERIVDRVSEERGLDAPRIYGARSERDDAERAGQDGGVVTELLATLLDAGELDGAIVATEHPEDPLRGVATLATSRAELLDAAGSSYNQVMGLGRMADLIASADAEEPRLALVGTPCVIQGASALERYDHDAANPIALTVALMCTRSFEYDRLVGSLAEHGVDPASVDTLDVADGVLFAYDEDGSVLLEESVDAFDAAGLRGCDECADFVGGGADISAGSVGSDDGETTLVVRTERGERAWERGREAIAADPLDETDALDSLAAWNRRRARRFLPREYDPDGAVDIGHDEHRAAYDDTDRAPEPLNPARVHQYEEWC
ncbi:MAG: Coenzyme F420 hydrogenase/dehydrogenase, beta subunit C-terminal domain [Haloplanus sp.]